MLLAGSYAKGTASVASDFDLIAITPSPRVGYRTWFEEQIRDPPRAAQADHPRPARGHGGTPADGTLDCHLALIA